MRQLVPGVDREDVLADDEEVVDRGDGAGDQPRDGCQGRPERAEPVDEQHQLVRHQDQANPPAHYEGKTSRAAKHDGYSTVDWGSLKNDQDCSGALACTVMAYDEKGNPVEADIRFNTEFKWSTTGASGAYDIQSVAAHEIGHVIQFDHVTNSSKRDHTVVMWPYLDIGDTSGRKLGRGDALGNNSHY